MRTRSSSLEDESIFFFIFLGASFQNVVMNLFVKSFDTATNISIFFFFASFTGFASGVLKAVGRNCRRQKVIFASLVTRTKAKHFPYEDVTPTTFGTRQSCVRCPEFVVAIFCSTDKRRKVWDFSYLPERGSIKLEAVILFPLLLGGLYGRDSL